MYEVGIFSPNRYVVCECAVQLVWLPSDLLVEMEGAREVRGERGRRESLETSGEGHRRAANTLQLVLQREEEEGNMFEMMRKGNSSLEVGGCEESRLTVEGVAGERAKEGRESTAVREGEGDSVVKGNREEGEEKVESTAKRKREEEDEKEESLPKRKREEEEDEEEGEWYDINPSQVPPHDEIMKKLPNKKMKGKTERQGSRAQADNMQTEDIRFAYPPQCSVISHSFCTPSKHWLKAVVSFEKENVMVTVSPQSRTPPPVLWSMVFKIELTHPKERCGTWVREGERGPSNTLCSVKIPKTDLEQFVHKGMVCIYVHYC